MLPCVLAPQDTALYKDIKRVSDTDIGVISQCFVARSAGIGYGNQPKGRCATLREGCCGSGAYVELERGLWGLL